MPYFLCLKGDDFLKNIRRKSIDSIADGISKFEDSKNILKKSDYTDLNTFVRDYLNTPEPKQRKKLAEEFKKRHLELYQFLKENSELVSAETEIAKLISSALSGDTSVSDNRQLTNLFEIIGEGIRK